MKHYLNTFIFINGLFMNKFLIETIKNPFSFSFLLIAYFIFTIIIFSNLTKTAKLQFCEKKTDKKIKLFKVSLITYILSICLVFYNFAVMPKAGFEVDDGIYAIGGYILKNYGTDNNNNSKFLPFFLFPQAKYHNETVYAVSLRATPAYFQALLQFFIKPGFRSIKFENALFTFFGSLLIGFSFYLISKCPIQSLFCAGIFNTLPWLHCMANLHPEGSAYMFGAACFIFGFYHLISNPGYLNFTYFLLSLTIFFFSWAPAFMVTPLCLIIFPGLLFLSSKENKNLALSIFFGGFIFTTLAYMDFYSEPGFKWNMGRPESLGCLPGLSPFNPDSIITGLKENWKNYLANYLGYLSPEFLFISGDGNLRHNSGFGGQALTCFSIPFYIGVYYCLFSKINIKNLNYKILLAYLLITVFPYSICKEGYGNPQLGLPLHAMRQCAMIVPLGLIIMVGLIRIARSNKNFFYFYLIAILINIGVFYNYYFNKYPYVLSNVWFNDPGLKTVSKKAYDILLKDPSKKLFYSAAPSTFCYHNLDRLKPEDVFYGDGLLKNIHDVNEIYAPPAKPGDLFIVQEPFDTSMLNKNLNYILRLKNKYTKNNDYGASLFEIVE